MTDTAPFKKRFMTIAVWAVLILIVVITVNENRSRQKHYQQVLSSSDVPARDATVLELAQKDRLVEVLTNTENPNEDAKSAGNVTSIKLRKDAVDSVARLSASGKLPVDVTMHNLFLLSKDADTTVKDAAKAGLADMARKDPATMQILVGQLKNGDPDIRGSARDVLGTIGGVSTAALIDPLVHDAIAGGDAQDTLGKIGAPAIPLISGHLNDPKADIRKKFAEMLGTIGVPAATSPLITVAASDADPAVRRSALVALTKVVIGAYDAITKAKAGAREAQRLGKPVTASGPTPADMVLVRSIEPILIKTLMDPDQDSSVRAQAAITIGRTASLAAVSTLVASIGDYDALVAHGAMQGVQSTGAPAVAPLIAVLATGSDTARRNAVEALGGIGTPEAIRAVTAILDNPASAQPIRRVAIQALGRSGNTSVISKLIDALGDKDGDVASAAQDALVSSELASTAIPQLIAAFTRPSPIPFNASQVLTNMENLSIPALKAALVSPEPQIQMWAAVSLGQSNTHDPEVAAALRPLQQSTNEQVRYAASEALAHVAGSGV